MLPAFENAKENSELAALVSDDPAKLKELGKRYGVTQLYSYDDYPACLRDGKIDAVYIGLPNHMHAAYTIKAAEAGVHVLCEKPMAVTEDECLRMIWAARVQRVKLMIAYRLHFEPANLNAIELTRAGKIGEPRFFVSTHSMDVREGNIRLDPVDQGGGPIYDIGVYCINAARYLFRSEPVEVFATMATGDDPRFENCEEMASVVMRFPGERLASFTCAFGSAKIATYTIAGTQGRLTLDPAYSYQTELKQELALDGKTSERTFPPTDQFGPQLSYFSDCVLENKDPEPSGEEGLNDVRIIRAIHKSARTRLPVALERLADKLMPDAAQEITHPPVKEPEVVKAEPPGAGE